jgi:hypothetical protein
VSDGFDYWPSSRGKKVSHILGENLKLPDHSLKIKQQIGILAFWGLHAYTAISLKTGKRRS